MVKHFGLFLLTILFTSAVFAGPPSLTYQGRILKADGTPLEYNNVSFIFQITDIGGSCVLYQEQVNGYDMTNSGGVFDTAIGLGTRIYPTSGVFTILDSLNNSGPLPCQGGSSYTPQFTDGRILRVQFYDGIGWKIITPDNVIRSVPYAGYAVASSRLGNNVAADFILKTGIPTCSAGTFLSWDGAALNCVPVAGASGGTVMNVTATAPLQVTAGSTNPALTITQATTSTSGYLSSADWNTFNSKLGTATAFVGDVSGTYGATSVDKIKGTAVTITTLASGNYLKYNGTAWVNATVSISDVSGLSTQLGNKLDVTNMPGSCAANQTLTFSSPSGAWVCSTIAITGTAFGSQSANLVLAAPDLAAGTPTFRALTANDLPTAISSGLWTASGANIYRNGGNVGIGTTNPVGALSVFGASGQGIQFTMTAGDFLLDRTDNSPRLYSNAKPLRIDAGTDLNLSYGNVGRIFAGGVEKIRLDASGNVGIGTLSPLSPLHVSALGDGRNYLDVYGNGGAPLAGFITRVARGTQAAPTATQTSDTLATISARGYGATGFSSGSRATMSMFASEPWSDTAQGAFITFSTTGSGTVAAAERMRIDTTGNVGIGSIAPAYKLDVNGIVNATGLYVNGVPFSSATTSTAVAATGGSAGTITQSSTDAATAVRTALTLQNTGTGGVNEYLIVGKNAAGTTTFSVNQAGSATLAGGLTSGGVVTSTSLVAPLLSGSTAASGTLTLDSTTSATKGNILIAPAGGNVGVGTTSPFANLHVNLTDNTLYTTSSAPQHFYLQNSSTTNGTAAGIFMSVTGGGAQIASGDISLVHTGSGSGDFAFSTRNTGTVSEKVRINSSGNVGIGTTTPGNKLDITTASNEATLIGNQATNVASLSLSNATSGLFFRRSTDGAATNGIFNFNDNAGSPDLGVRTRNDFQIFSNVTPVFIVKSTGYVGIGTATPARTLDIRGGAYGNNQNLGLQIGTPGGQWISKLSIKSDGSGVARTAIDATDGGSTGVTNEAISIGQTGNVGILATAPASKLQVGNLSTTAWQSASLGNAYYSSPATTYNTGFVGFNVSGGGNAYTTGSDTSANGGALIMSDIFGNMRFATITSTGATSQSLTGADIQNAIKMTVMRSGNVGIGTMSPGVALDVIGTVRATAFSGPLTSSTTSVGAGSNGAPSMTFSGDATTGFYDTSSNGTISVAASGAKTFDFNSTGLVSPTTGGANLTTGAGTVGAPTFSFAGDTGTGWWRPAASTMAASTGGAERMRIDSSGNVGIGTASPISALHVQGDVRSSGSNGFILSGYGGMMPLSGGMGVVTGGANPVVFATNGSTNERMRIDSVGNVGVGTAAPTNSLTVFKTPTTGTISSTGAAVTGTGTNFTTALSVGDQIYAGTQVKTVTAISSATALTLSSGFTTDLAASSAYARIGETFNAGYVGIGTTSPLVFLDVVNTNSSGTTVAVIGQRFSQSVDNKVMVSARNLNTNGAATNPMGGFAAEAYDSLNGGYARAIFGLRAQTTGGGNGDTVLSAPKNINFLVNRGIASEDTAGSYGTTAMSIGTNAYVGIGTGSPAFKFDVYGGQAHFYTTGASQVMLDSAAGNPRTVLMTTGAVNRWRMGANTTGEGGSNGGSDFQIDSYTDAGTGLGTPFVIQRSSGNVGIGTTGPAYPLDVAGVIQTSGKYIVSKTGTTSTANTWYLAGAATDQKTWDVYQDVNSWSIRAVNDAYTASNNAISIVRGTGNTVGSVLFQGGSVGIGTSTPAAPLHVYTANTSGNIASFLSASGGCSIAYNGTSCSSDARLKENVETSDSTAMLNNLLQVRSVHFTWIKDPNHEKQTGFIAQELQKLFPEFIKTDSNGLLQVNYASFVSVLTAAIQEMNTKFTKQFQSNQRDIASVNARVDAVETAKDKEIKELKEHIRKQDAEMALIKKKLGL